MTTIAMPDPRPPTHDGPSMSPLPAAPTAQAPSLLVVDDEPELRGLLAEYFSRHGFVVRMAEHAAHARELLAQARPQLALLDVNMPGENGLALARWMREAHPEVAIVMLTTAGEAIDRIVGLEMGADDYLPKPFELRELLARVRAVLRRSQAVPAASASAAPVDVQPPAQTHQVRFGDRLLDLDQRKLFAPGGAEIEITAAEFDLLALFARHPNRPLNRDQIMEQAHNRSWDVFDRRDRRAHV